MPYTIYAVTSRTDEKRYVGQTTQSLRRRLGALYWNAKLRKGGPGSLIGAAMVAEGLANFDIEALEVCDDPSTADAAEAKWIDDLNCWSPQGYNVRPAGRLNPAIAESTKQKMRGRYVGPETREKLAALRRGQPATPAARFALAAGRIKRQDHLRAGAVRGEKNPRAILRSEDVSSIREEYARGGVTQQALAERFKVCQSTIAAIINRRTWPEDY